MAVLLLVAVIVWANQREAASRASEARALQSEARVATAEAVIVAQAQAQSATATALAYATSPEAACGKLSAYCERVYSGGIGKIATG